MLRASSSSTTGIHTVTSNRNLISQKIYKISFIKCPCKHDVYSFSGPYLRCHRLFVTRVNATKLQQDAGEPDKIKVTANSVKRMSKFQTGYNQISMYKVDDEEPSDFRMAQKPGSEQQLDMSREIKSSQRSDANAIDPSEKKYPWKNITRVVGPGVHVINGFEDDAFFHRLSTTSSGEEAWQVYESLRLSRAAGEQQYSEKVNRLSVLQDRAKIPFVLRHRLARLLVRLETTRTVFYRLKTLLADIQKDGGHIHVWEWNALIHCAGSGWRKTRLENYRSALRIYYDMQASLSIQQDSPRRTKEHKSQPDIYTYTTLLDTAMRTHNPQALRHALFLLESSGLPPSRITLLTILRYRSKMNDLHGIQDVLEKLTRNKYDIGVDSINAVLWFHARAGRFHVAWRIYGSMMKNLAMSAMPSEERKSIEQKKVEPKDIEGLLIPDDALPDEATFALMIQALTYHGYFFEASDVWRDMLSTPKEHKQETATFDIRDMPIDITHQPILHIFRNFFLGFSRHGGGTGILPPFATRMHDESSPWTVANLTSLFEVFMDSSITGEYKPSDRIIFWIMKAFAKTTNHDPKVLKSVWNELETRFDRHWSGRMLQLQRKFSDKGEVDQPVQDKFEK